MYIIIYMIFILNSDCRLSVSLRVTVSLLSAVLYFLLTKGDNPNCLYFCLHFICVYI